MPNFVCTTCGTQYPESLLPAEHCAICTEERQYVGWKGQLWTTVRGMASAAETELVLVQNGFEELKARTRK